mmetsp:Transcript_23537/g.45972  ORF Transcript_23537/g.45972 Transcript_23537/m.45972 type:complete len:324 (-) Transcript_23537:235-1206(-)
MADDSSMSPFDTGHEEMIHDAQLDYYGKRVATASSDRTIKIFELQGKTQTELAHLKGHTGPVWQVAWGHPSLGNLLASCSYDRKVCIWQEVRKNQWQCIHTDNCHQASVNAVAWAPHELGRVLACASADGTVSIISYTDNRWVREGPFQAHPGGVNAVSWAPAIPSGSLVLPQNQSGMKLQKCIVTGGCDNKLKIWRFSQKNNQWDEETKIFGNTNGLKHQGWVRDVAWAPSLGLPGNTIASCSEDGLAIIWSDGKNGAIEPVKEIKGKEKMWRVSWSTMGNILAISMGNNTVSLWKESVDGKWQDLAECNEGLPNKQDQKMG